MKIVHICLCGIVTEGFTYQENLLSKYHQKIGNEVYIITSKWTYDKKEVISLEKTNYYNDDNVFIIRLNNHKNQNHKTKLKRFYGLYNNLSSIKPDIIFIHGVQFLDMIEIVRYLKQNRNTKVFVDNHSDFSNSARNILSKYILHEIIWRHMAKIIEPYTTKFYGVLPARVDFLKNIYKLPANKCELLVMGADDELVEKYSDNELRKKIRNDMEISDDDLVIVTGGKIDKFKLQTLLLMKAVKNIENPKIKLLIFGSIEEDIKQEFDKLCDKEKIQYLGWANTEESYKYFSIADLVAFPGRHSVYWEQVTAMGIPMICKYWEGTTHIDIGGNVKFLKEDSIEEIQRVLEEIINDTNIYQNMKNNAMKIDKEEFLYSKIANKSIE